MSELKLPPHSLYLTDTIEGWREASVLETFFENYNFPIWEEAIHHIPYDYDSVQEWRLKRIEWCINKIKKGVYS